MNRPLWDGPSEPLCGARPGSGAAIVSLSGARIGPGCARSACAARRSASSGGPGSSGRGGGNLLRCVPSVGRATLQAVDEIGSLTATRSLWRIAIPPAGIGMMEQNPLAHGILGPPDGTVSPDGSRTGRTADARAARSRSAPAPRRAYQMSRRRRAGYPRSRPRSLDPLAFEHRPPPCSRGTAVSVRANDVNRRARRLMAGIAPVQLLGIMQEVGRDGRSPKSARTASPRSRRQPATRTTTSAACSRCCRRCRRGCGGNRPR